jgi:hypothetical protein
MDSIIEYIILGAFLLGGLFAAWDLTDFISLKEIIELFKHTKK